jgi:hypothetical protein
VNENARGVSEVVCGHFSITVKDLEFSSIHQVCQYFRYPMRTGKILGFGLAEMNLLPDPAQPGGSPYEASD